MKYCKNCKVNVDANKNYCPLCFRELTGETEKNQDEFLFAERKKNETFNKNNTFVLKLFIFISVCAISACLLINLLVNANFLWSLLVIASVVYIWILVAHTIISRRGVFEKIFMQLLGIMLILYVCEYISYDTHWLANYVFPSISMATVATLLMITFIRKDKSWMLAFVFIIALLTLSSVLFFIYLDTFKILNIINLAFCALSLFGYLTFGFNTIKTDFAKKFHL